VDAAASTGEILRKEHSGFRLDGTELSVIFHPNQSLIEIH
jgi:hypothetical protein